MAYTLADLRIMHNKSYQDVCDYLNMNVRSYRSYEGKNYIPQKHLIKLSKYYSVSLSDIDTTPKTRFSSRGKERRHLSFDLKKIRNSLNLSQREVAEKIGISKYLISEIERLGTCRPEHYKLLIDFAAEHRNGPTERSLEELTQLCYDLEKRVKILELQLALQ